jgi:hypothetical protein
MILEHNLADRHRIGSADKGEDESGHAHECAKHARHVRKAPTGGTGGGRHRDRATDLSASRDHVVAEGRDAGSSARSARFPILVRPTRTVDLQLAVFGTRSWRTSQVWLILAH